MITADQVTALAPDAKSFKAGKALATTRQWSSLARNERALWGLAQGSGKKPYQTQVALDDLASKCSCPSRKFPCKHALGLLFLAANDLSHFDEASPPEWVTEWHDSRSLRAEKAASKKVSKAKPKDAPAAKKRQAKREDRIREGVDFLESYVFDLIRDGLGQERVTDLKAWETVSKRLIDCQAPGLSGFARRLGELPHTETNWEHRMVLELGSLHLLLETYRKRESLSAPMRAEVEQLIGWPVDQETVRAGEPVQDTWFVAQRHQRETDRLVTSATWLYGRETRRWALTLNFAALPSRPVEPWPIGADVRTSLAFYPGLAPDRALPTQANAPATLTEVIPESQETFQSLLERVADAMAVNPWRTRHPFLLAGHPSEHAGSPVILDTTGQALPWKPHAQTESMLRSVCAGHPVMLAGEWDGYHLHLHAAADGLSWFSLRTHVA